MNRWLIVLLLVFGCAVGAHADIDVYNPRPDPDLSGYANTNDMSNALNRITDIESDYVHTNHTGDVAIAGNVSLGVVTGPELLSDGGFDLMGPGWGTVAGEGGVNWIFAGSYAELTESTTNAQFYSTDLVVVSGYTYRVSFDCVSGINSNLTVTLGGAVVCSQVVVAASGYYTWDVTAISTDTLRFYGTHTCTVCNAGVDNISVKQLGISTIDIYGEIDLHGFGIRGIGPHSIEIGGQTVSVDRITAWDNAAAASTGAWDTFINTTYPAHTNELSNRFDTVVYTSTPAYTAALAEVASAVQDGDTLSVGLSGPHGDETNDYVTLAQLSEAVGGVGVLYASTNTSLGVVGFYDARTFMPTHTQSVIQVAGVTNGQYLASWISNTNLISAIREGIAIVGSRQRITSATGGKSLTTRPEIYVTDQDGNTLYEFETSQILTLTTSFLDRNAEIDCTNLLVDATNRLAVKWKAVTAANSPTWEFQCGSGLVVAARLPIANSTAVLTDAPADGSTYGRKDRVWSPVVSTDDAVYLASITNIGASGGITVVTNGRVRTISGAALVGLTDSAYLAAITNIGASGGITITTNGRVRTVIGDGLVKTSETRNVVLGGNVALGNRAVIGYVTNVSTDDLVVNGAFADATVWTWGGTWYWNAGNAAVGDPASTLSQNIIGLTPGATYRVIYSMNNHISVKAGIGGTWGTQYAGSSGTRTNDIVAVNTNGIQFYGVNDGFAGYIDNVSAYLVTYIPIYSYSNIAVTGDVSIVASNIAVSASNVAVTANVAVVGDLVVNMTNLGDEVEALGTSVVKQVVLNGVTNNPTSGVIDLGTIQDLVPGYMCFDIPLNPGQYPGNWTDYEIKIVSVTNSVEEWTDPKLVYYYKSMATNAVADDTNATVYIVDDYDAFPEEERGVLKWKKLLIHTNIYEQLTNASTVIERVYHYPSHDGCLVNWQTWYWYTNAHNLRASFVRYDAVGVETNKTGTAQHWQPIEPTWILYRKNEQPLNTYTN